MTSPAPIEFLPMSLLGWNFDATTNVISITFTKGDPTEKYEPGTMTKTFVVRLQGIEAPVECLPGESPEDAIARAVANPTSGDTAL